MKPKKIKDLINYHFPKKKLSIIDCGCHKGLFLKKIGLKKLKGGILIDPIDYKIIKKFNLKNFNYYKYAVGSTKKVQIFKIYSTKYPEWSSIHSLGKKSIYKKNYSKYLNARIIKKKISQITLDSLIYDSNKKFDILKIDCQSSTFDILKGCKKNLSSKKFKVIIVAVNLGEFYKNTKDDFIKILTLLKSNGYNLINVANAHSGKLGSIDYDYKNYNIWTFDAIFML